MREQDQGNRPGKTDNGEHQLIADRDIGATVASAVVGSATVWVTAPGEVGKP